MARGDVDAERRHKALEALARDPNQSAAARASGFTRMTISRLLDDADFVARLESRRAEIAAELDGGQRAQILADNVQTLISIRDDGGAKAADRIKAASTLHHWLNPAQTKATPNAPAAEPKAKAPVLKLSPEDVRKKYG